MRSINKENIPPKEGTENNEFGFWGYRKCEIQTPLEKDFYIGQGVTMVSGFTASEFPYTVVEIEGKVGNRIVTLESCRYNDSTKERELIEKYSDWCFDRQRRYIKEETLNNKLNKGNSYNHYYVRNRRTGRLNKEDLYFVWTGWRQWYIPREITG